jgi:hypothetical protein
LSDRAITYTDDLFWEIEDLHKLLAPPPLDVIRRLRAEGVSPDALAEPELPAFADVVFHDDRPLFDFIDEAAGEAEVPAIIFLARDEEGEPRDLVAWSCKKNRLAAWFGAATMLGEDYLAGPRLEDGLRVCADPLEWLRAERLGVVILDARRACWRLAEERLIVGDVAFGRRVRDALRLPEPTIFVAAAQQHLHHRGRQDARAAA